MHDPHANPVTPTLPFVIGHRGAAGHAPENTLAAIRTAATLGCTWVEVDVRPAADGRPVLHHDAGLWRTTGRRDTVETTPFDVITGLQARAPDRVARNNDQAHPASGDNGHAGETIPSLDAALRLVSSLRLGINLEIKPAAGRSRPVAPAVVDAVRRHLDGSPQRVLLSSFDLTELAAARATMEQNGGRLPLACLYRRLSDDWRRDVETVGACAVGLDDDQLSRHDVEVIHSARPDLPVIVFTVNDPHRAAQCSRWGVSSVFSDVPDVLMRTSQGPAQAS